MCHLHHSPGIKLFLVNEGLLLTVLGEFPLKCFSNRDVIFYQKKAYASTEYKVYVFTVSVDFHFRVIFKCVHK